MDGLLLFQLVSFSVIHMLLMGTLIMDTINNASAKLIRRIKHHHQLKDVLKKKVNVNVLVQFSLLELKIHLGNQLVSLNAINMATHQRRLKDRFSAQDKNLVILLMDLCLRVGEARCNVSAKKRLNQ